VADDILLEARGDTAQLRSQFEGAAKEIEAAMDRAATAVEKIQGSLELAEGALASLDVSATADQVSDLEAAVDSFEEAAQRGSSTSEQLGEAVSRVAEVARDTASAVGETAESYDDLAESSETAATAQEEAADAARDSKEALEEVADTARDTGAASSEAGKVLARAFREGREGLQELASANGDLQEQIGRLDELAAKVRNLGDASAEGFGEFGANARDIAQQISSLETLLDRQGAQEIPELRSALEGLESQYLETFRAGAREAAQVDTNLEQQQAQLRRIQLEAEAAEGGAVDLTEVFRLRFPKVTKAIGTAAAALGTFKIAFQETRSLIEGIRENFGIDIDQLATRWLKLDEVAQHFVGTGDDLVNTFLRLGNQLNTLGGAGAKVEELRQEFDALAQSVRSSDGEIKIQGDDVERLQELVRRAAEQWKAYAASQKEAGGEASDALLAVQALAEEVEGVKADELATDFEHLVDAARGLADTARTVENQPLFEAWRDRAAEVRKIIRTMPDELRTMFEAASGQDADAAVDELERMAETLGEVITQTKEAQEAAAEHAKAQAEAAREAGKAWRDVVTQLEKLAQAGTDALPEAPGTLTPEVDVAGAESRLAALEKRLTDIRSKPVVSLDEVNLETSLFSQIAEARNELANLRAQVPIELDTTNLGAQAADALNDALASSNFEDAFRGLDTAAQQQVASLISQFDGLLRASQTLDPAIIQDYGQAIQQALGTDGAAAATALGASLGTLGQSSSDTIARLLEIAQTGSTANASLTEFDQTVQQVDGSAGEGTITLTKTGETLAQLGEQAKAGSTGVAEAGTSLQQLAQDATTAADAADGTRIRIAGTGEAIEITRVQAEEGAGALERLGTGAAQAEPAISATADAGQRAGEGLGQAAQGAADLATNLDPIAGHSAAETLLQLAEISTTTAAPLATLASNAGDAGTQLGTVADASERIVAAEGVPEAITLTAEAAAAAAPGVGQLAEQASVVATAVETVVEKGVELPDLLSQWGASAETLASQLQPINEGALGEHRTVVTETATAYRDTVTAQAELGTQIGTLAGQLGTLQEQLVATNTRLDEGIAKHRDYDRSLEETGEKLDDFAVTIDETHKALADLVDEEVLGRLAQLNSLLANTATSLKAVEANALAAASAVAQVPQ